MNIFNKKQKIINIDSLKDQLLLYYKKRNFTKNNPETHTKNANLTQKHNNLDVKYIKIRKTYVTYKLKKQLKTNQKTYVERNNKYISKSLYILSKTTSKLINKNKSLYRSVNNECLIETVAKTYAHSILLKEKFNVFENFSELTKVIRVYKKEAEILNVLIINELIKIYLILLKDIQHIKLDIKKGSRIKVMKKNINKSPAFIYGVYLFNPKATNFLYKRNNLIISSTTKVLNELDTIYSKQRIIFNHIKYLSRGIV